MSLSCYFKLFLFIYSFIFKATIRNKRIKGEISLLKLQENSLNHFENHLSCIKGLLQQYKIESFEKNMTIFTKELMDLKFMVTETLAAGSNYLFAKYEAATENVVNYSENNDNDVINFNDQTATSNSSHYSKSAYKRILTEMASLSAAQSVEQVQNRRKEISLELSEKNKISTISDFEVFAEKERKSFYFHFHFYLEISNGYSKIEYSNNFCLTIIIK